MRIIENEKIETWYDRNSAALFEDIEFRKCKFESCGVSTTTKPNLRSTVRNIRFVDCSVRGCGIDSVIAEDILVNGLKTLTLLQVWAAVFKHVTLKGDIGSIMISKLVDPVGTATTEEVFQRANAEYYKKVDWALDITEVSCKELDIRGIPARMIKRDPTTQGVVRRANVIDGKWQRKLANNEWSAWIETMLKEGDEDVVLVTPKRSRRFQKYMDDLKQLRDEGIADSE